MADKDLEPAILGRRSIAPCGKLQSLSQYICPDPEQSTMRIQIDLQLGSHLRCQGAFLTLDLYLRPVAVHVILAVR